MAGVTNAPFRRICRQQAQRALADCGIKSDTTAPYGIYVCEMITARALVEQNPVTLSLLKPDMEEQLRSVQLHGVDPSAMGSAAQILVEQGLADHLDINFGCPVPKVTRKGGGAALPWKLDRFRQIVAAVIAGAKRGADKAAKDFPVPVTCKIRIGIDDKHLTYLDGAQIAAEEGCSAVF